MTKHRFSNSARVREQVIELAEQPLHPTVGQSDFRGLDWLMGRRKLLVVPARPEGTSLEALQEYVKLVVSQQDIILRRLFWLGFLVSFVTGIVAGTVGATWALVK